MEEDIKSINELEAEDHYGDLVNRMFVNRYSDVKIADPKKLKSK